MLSRCKLRDGQNEACNLAVAVLAQLEFCLAGLGEDGGAPSASTRLARGGAKESDAGEKGCVYLCWLADQMALRRSTVVGLVLESGPSQTHKGQSM